ncbi:hypothetical protein UP17_03055 [Peribacillus simplex]|uniref:hypothetical protein n=1 Tax=Peribacillus simplex TaxID=1478 RepID=UPI0007770A79|nr:hypothetical protein [Peribacillus simplex]AMM91681.1 hypothetical protein UP17_03055 [Peribacillus simplex]
MFYKIAVFILLFSLTISTTDNVRAQSLSNQNQKIVFEYTPNYNRLYSFLNITEQKYTNSIKVGKTMAEIAENQGISKQSLINFLSNEMTAQLDKQLNEGKINKETHEHIKSNLNRAIQYDINYRFQKPNLNP